MASELEQLKERVAILEERVDDILAALHEGAEHTLRAIGRLDRAAEYCRRLADRIEALEQEHVQLSTNVHMAGGALVTGVDAN